MAALKVNLLATSKAARLVDNLVDLWVDQSAVDLVCLKGALMAAMTEVKMD